VGNPPCPFKKKLNRRVGKVIPGEFTPACNSGGNRSLKRPEERDEKEKKRWQEKYSNLWVTGEKGNLLFLSRGGERIPEKEVKGKRSWT